MTLRDVEVIELLAEKPELLAIADAVSATQRKGLVTPARRRRIAVRGGIVVAIAVAAIVAILAAPQGKPGGVLGKALAAVGDGRVMYVVTQFDPGLFYVDLKTGHRTPEIMREQLWVDRQGDHFHLVLSINGRVLGDLLYPQDAKNGGSPVAPTDPAFVALWTGYRAALRNGTVTLAGRGTFHGRPIYWLRFASASTYAPRTEVAVDAHTYRPILYRTGANGRHIDERILVAKARPYAPGDFRRRGPSLLSGSGTVSSGGSGTAAINPSAPPTRVGTRWLTAGKTVAGLRLRSVVGLSVSSNFPGKPKVTVNGLELTYGNVSSQAPPPLTTTIDELPRPDDPRAWARLPAGSMQVETGEESGSGGSHTLWTGTLKKDGLYITIQTPKGVRAVIAIARALHHPAPG
jgi:hypothetical protein